MSFFEYQYGDRREPKGAYALCCQAIRKYFDRELQKLTEKDPGDMVIPVEIRSIPRQEVMHAMLMAMHDRLIEGRITTSGRIADGKSAHAFLEVIIGTLLHDFVILEHAVRHFRPMGLGIFRWLYNSRKAIAELLRFVRIRYLIVDIKYNSTNGSLIAELNADMQKMRELLNSPSTMPNNPIRRVAEVLEENNE